MSEMYSSQSGSYGNYLAQRQTDEIKKSIKSASIQQSVTTALSTGYLGSKIDSVNNSIERMSTGIQTSINQNTLTVAASSIMLNNTFHEGFDSINNTLDLGFAGVQRSVGFMSASMSAGFSGLTDTIERWGGKICDKLDAIHDIVNNPLLTASRELYRRAATNASKQFFEEALEDIKGAVEKNKTDYISWGLMGKIYLFGISEFGNVVDVPKALEALKNACKYISPDIDESSEAKKMASEYYFYLAYAYYILSNESRIANKQDEVTKYLEESVRANAKSYVLSNTMFESAYNQARDYALLGKKENALKKLEEAIRKDGFYSIKALGDADFSEIADDIIVLIKKLRDELYSNFQDIFPDVKNIAENYEFVGGSYCDSVRDSFFNALNIKPDTEYLDIRVSYDVCIDVLDKIKNKAVPLDMEVFNSTKQSDNGKLKIAVFAFTETTNIKEMTDILKIRTISESDNHESISFESTSRWSCFYGCYSNTYKNCITNRYYVSDSDKYIGCCVTFLSNRYGKIGKVVQLEGIENIDKKFWNDFDTSYEHGSELTFHTYEEYKTINCPGSVENRDSYVDVYTYTWNLDENTTLTIPDLHKNGQRKIIVRQRGIVTKKYFDEYNSKLQKIFEEKEEAENKAERERLGDEIDKSEANLNSLREEPPILIKRIKETKICSILGFVLLEAGVLFMLFGPRGVGIGFAKLALMIIAWTFCDYAKALSGRDRIK